MSWTFYGELKIPDAFSLTIKQDPSKPIYYLEITQTNNFGDDKTTAVHCLVFKRILPQGDHATVGQGMNFKLIGSVMIFKPDWEAMKYTGMFAH